MKRWSHKVHANWLCPVYRKTYLNFLQELHGIRLQEWPLRTSEAGLFNPLPAKIKTLAQTRLHPSGCCLHWCQCTLVLFQQQLPSMTLWIPKCFTYSLPIVLLECCRSAHTSLSTVFLPAEQIIDFTFLQLCSTAFHSPYLCLLNHVRELGKNNWG